MMRFITSNRNDNFFFLSDGNEPKTYPKGYWDSDDDDDDDSDDYGYSDDMADLEYQSTVNI